MCIRDRHEVPGEVGQVGYHAVFDVAGVLPEEQHPAHLPADLEVVGLELHPIRGDGVLEAVSPLHSLGQVDAEVLFLAGAEKVMENAEPFMVVQGMSLIHI